MRAGAPASAGHLVSRVSNQAIYERPDDGDKRVDGFAADNGAMRLLDA